MTHTNRERLITLYKEYELTKEDVFTQTLGKRQITIITRTGIEKIAAKKGLRVTYKLAAKPSPEYGAVKATACDSNGTWMSESYGTACKATSHNQYYLEMAEKRALSRAVLKALRFYELGVYGEDEADDFKRREGE